jgi:hypothetical protein
MKQRIVQIKNEYRERKILQHSLTGSLIASFKFICTKRLLFPALLLISIPVFAQFKVRFIVGEASCVKSHDSNYIAGRISLMGPLKLLKTSKYCR